MFDIYDGSFSNERSGFLFNYAQITANQVKRFVNLKIKLKPQEGLQTFTHDIELEDEFLEIKITSVIMSNLFLESYIFDYCARRKSATFAKNYIDKLSTPAKWVIVTNLFSPSPILESDQIIRRIKDLNAYRNKLVHHKTVSIDTPVEFNENFDPFKCINILKEVMDKIFEVDPNEQYADFISSHINSWVSNLPKYPNMYPIMREC